MHSPLPRRRSRLSFLTTLVASAFAAAIPAQAGAATHAVVSGGGHPITGIVQSAGPVKGAQVVLVDRSGRLITRVPTKTNQRGVFVLRLNRRLPSVFIARAIGGRDALGAVHGTLSAEFGGYDRGEPVLVNGATTLAVAYHAAHPRLPGGAVEARVARFLGLPADTDLGVELTLSDHAFNGTTYTKAAHGNVALYSRRLVRGIDLHKHKAFPRVGSTAVSSLSTSGVTKQDLPFTNTQLINGTSALASKIPEIGGVAGPAIGLIMSLTLGADPDPELVELKQIEAKLDEVGQSLSYSIGLQHAAGVRADYNAYTLSVSGSSVTDIEAASHMAWILYTTALKERLDPAARTRGSFAAAEADTSNDTFLAYYNDANGGMSAAGNHLIDGMGTIATLMNRTGSGTGDSPLALWKRAVNDDRFITKEDQQRYFQAWEYWRTLHAHLLIMDLEYAHTTKGAAKRPFVATWIQQFARQGNPGNATEGPGLANWSKNAGLDKIDQYLLGGQVYDHGTNLVWGTDPSRIYDGAQAAAANDGRFDVGVWKTPNWAQITGLFANQPHGMLGAKDSGFATDQAYLLDGGFQIANCQVLFGRDNGTYGGMNLLTGQEDNWQFSARKPYCVAPVFTPAPDHLPAPPLD